MKEPMVMKTWITSKDDLLNFTLEGYKKELQGGFLPRIFIGIDPYGFLKIYHIDEIFGKSVVFHQDDGPLDYCQQQVMHCLFHTAILGFATKTCLVLFPQDMEGCDKCFVPIDEELDFPAISIEKNFHISEPEESKIVDLYMRSPKFNQPWTEQLNPK